MTERVVGKEQKFSGRAGPTEGGGGKGTAGGGGGGDAL